ncbi:uncharacterized protein VP01_10847g1, partial [Puccinia sorghi]
AQAFLQQTGLYCLAHPDRFPDDRSKIIFMLTNLSGDAAKWAQLLNQRVLNKSDPDVTPPTLAKFITTIRKRGVLPAVQRPRLQFHLERPLVSLYRGGLKENIQIAILSSGKAFLTHPDIQALAMQLGNSSNAGKLVIYIETAQRRRTPADLPDPFASLT